MKYSHVSVLNINQYRGIGVNIACILFKGGSIFRVMFCHFDS